MCKRIFVKLSVQSQVKVIYGNLAVDRYLDFFNFSNQRHQLFVWLLSDILNARGSFYEDVFLSLNSFQQILSFLFKSIKHFQHLFANVGFFFLWSHVNKFLNLIDIFTTVYAQDHFCDCVRDVLYICFLSKLLIQHFSKFLATDKALLPWVLVDLCLLSGTKSQKFAHRLAYYFLYVNPVAWVV